MGDLYVINEGKEYGNEIYKKKRENPYLEKEEENSFFPKSLDIALLEAIDLDICIIEDQIKRENKEITPDNKGYAVPCIIQVKKEIECEQKD